MNTLFNIEYTKPWRELFVMALLVLVKKKNHAIKNNRILIVNPSLIGEFSATVPAIFQFIEKNKDKQIDLLVSPNLKSMAERISGIGKVYILSSREQDFESYGRMVIMRLNGEAFKAVKNIGVGDMETSLSIGVKYIFHLTKNLILGRTPKIWREVNFEILHKGKGSKTYFSDMFKFGPEDYANVEKIFNRFNNTKQKIVIHTWANWPMKRWDNEKWISLLKEINSIGNFTFIFVGSKADLENYEYISSKLDFQTESLINKIDIPELLLVLKKADYFIGIDSGPRNLAHLVDLRSITILGPGPHIYLPSNPMDIVIDKSNGRGVIQLFISVKNSFMKKIAVEEVFNAFKNLYKKVEYEKNN